MSKAGKRIRKAREGIDRNKAYGVDEALKLVKSRAGTKFNETVDIAMNLGVDPKHADQMVLVAPRLKKPRPLALT
jgi:large subunit ribosomal protein L1